ncbi:tRNA pseudouridine(38-40) synthase TruA [Desulfomarina sp.]
MKSRNIKLVIGYDGTGFSGWQRQKEVGKTIQGTIETCLNRMTCSEITLHGAGRTDAGVHAEGMVAHFRTTASITPAEFLQALNAMLPGAIRIFQADEVDQNFHSRFSAIKKTYRYSIFTGSIQPPNIRLYSLHIKTDLKLDKITQALSYLEGTHDFSSFENSGTRDKHATSGRGAVRTLYRASVHQEKDLMLLEFTGDGFLRNMVRNIVGTALDCGRNRLTPEQFKKILGEKDRSCAGPTAPAHGLSLIKVFY